MEEQLRDGGRVETATAGYVVGVGVQELSSNWEKKGKTRTVGGECPLEWSKATHPSREGRKLRA